MIALPLEDAYRQMATIRQFEEKTAELKTQGLVPGSIHLAIGQEAVPVGACSQMQPDDAVTATYRGHGWALARGTSPADAFAEMMGRQSNLCGGRGGSPFFSDAATNFLGENSIVGGGVPIALGAAVDSWQRKRKAVSIVSIGDGALSQGGTHEALNFAAALALPLIVVVEDNIYSEMSPWRDMVGIDDLETRAVGYGIASTTVDGNDAQAVAAAVGEARSRAVDDGGPSFIVARTERLVGHYSGDAQAYRPRGEIESAKEREPLVALRRRLTGTDPSFDPDAVDQAVTRTINDAVTEAAGRPEPDPSTLEHHLYA